MLGLQRPCEMPCTTPASFSVGQLHRSWDGGRGSARTTRLLTSALLSSNLSHSNGSGKPSFHNSNGSTQTAEWDQVAQETSQQPSANEAVITVLQQVASGELRPTQAASLLQQQAFSSPQAGGLSSAGLHQEARMNPEVVWAPGKRPAQIAAYMRQAAAADRTVVAVRVEDDVAATITREIPEAIYNQRACTLRLRSEAARKAQKRLAGTIAVLAAESADAVVAEECRVVADALGCYAFRLPNVSVDRMDVVLSNVGAVQAADVIVVVSGTDGALPSIIAGLVSAPVIAVPSVGAAGAALQGSTGLLGAVAAASTGVAVSQVDSGVGAAMLAARVLRCADRLRQPPAS